MAKTRYGNVLLTQTLRLPDEIQEDALRLLEMSKDTVDWVIEQLWSELDNFLETDGQVYKQVEKQLERPHNNGSRQWRCEAETAGRLLRSQATRKQVFEKIYPMFTEQLFLPESEGRKRRKDKKMVDTTLRLWLEELGDESEKYTYAIAVLEQAMRFYIENDRFPSDFYELQEKPTLKTGFLTYAADDGGKNGQAHRFRVEGDSVYFRLRAPNAVGKFRWLDEIKIPLSENMIEFVKNSRRICSPNIRVVEQADGGLVAVLDIIIEREATTKVDWKTSSNVLGFDWGVRKMLTAVVLSPGGEQISTPYFLNTGGFDGKQARLRRQIDFMKSKRDVLPEGSEKHKKYDHEIQLCWKAYRNRNKAMSHFASNWLILIALAHNCDVIAGEWLATLKSTGRGRNTKSRWRKWRNNSTIRSQITEKLKYKAKLNGIKTRFENPRHTSHTCPRCGKACQTFTSPEHQCVNNWGAWLQCQHCGWNGSRDYAAAINIARLAATYFAFRKDKREKTLRGLCIRDSEYKPASYIGAGAALPFPPPDNGKNIIVCSHRITVGNRTAHKLYFAGWLGMIPMSFRRKTPVKVYVYV